MKTIVRPKSLTELATDQLREWIIAGELDLGSQLSEARLAKELGISRTPVREAINRLEIEGLLVVEPQRGSFVFNLAPAELAKLCDARVCMETTALAEAIRVAPQALHRALAECVEAMADARGRNDDSRYLALDTVFHQAFFDFAENRFLNEAYQTIAQKMAAVRNRLGRHPEHMAKSFREHGEMADAVRQGDCHTALAILKRHIDRKEGSYWQRETSDPANLRWC